MKNHLNQKTNGKTFITKDQWKIIYIKRPMENHLYKKTKENYLYKKTNGKSFI